jgi:hypothetical protein
MTTAVEKRFDVEVIYNGVGKALQVEPRELIAVLLQKAIAEFHVTQNPHLLSLFRQDGTAIPENETVECAGIKPREILLLRPNAVKGGDRPLELAVNVLDATFRHLRECGRGECECVVYWTGPSDSSRANAVEHPVHHRAAFGYQIGDAWLTDFWKRLAASKRGIKAQIHTHPGEAFHSATDDTWPIVSQAGFMSIVIPDFGRGAISLKTAWIGRLDPDGSWRHLASADRAITFA